MPGLLAAALAGLAGCVQAPITCAASETLAPHAGQPTKPIDTSLLAFGAYLGLACNKLGQAY